MSELAMSKEIADFASSLQYDDLDDVVLLAAKQSILDWVGVALAGSHEPIANVVYGLLTHMNGGSGGSVVGCRDLVPPPFAALANGTIGHALDFDDTHLAAKLHTTTTVLPAVLAVADAHELSGQDIIVSYVAGFEAAATIACAVNPEHYEAGWHATGTIGTLGAAVGAGRALGLSVDDMARALSLAGTQSAGLQRVFGSMAKPFNAGRAALSGTLAAFLAAEGMTAPDDVLQGPRGLFTLLGATDAIDSGHPVGSEFHILDNTVKLHACCHALHAAIEATLHLRDQIGEDVSAVSEVAVRGWPVIGQIAAIEGPTTGYEAKFSLYHAIAVALLEGDAGPSQFADARVADVAIRNLAQKVSFQPGPSLDIDAAVVTLSFADGREQREATASTSGLVGNPELWPMLERKFRSCGASSLAKAPLQGAIDRLQGLETQTHVAPFWTTLVGVAGDGRPTG